MASPEMPPRGDLQYSHVNFPSSNENQRRSPDSRNSTDYSAVDAELTAAVQNARISLDLGHFH